MSRPALPTQGLSLPSVNPVLATLSAEPARDAPVEEAEPPQCTSPAPLASRELESADEAELLVGKAIPGTHRVVGDALRKSLRLTTVAWLYGAFWMASTSGLTQTRLASYLGANDIIFGLLGAMPCFAVLLQVPGSMLVDRLGHRKAILLWAGTIHRLLYLLMALLPWVLPSQKVGSVMVMALLLFVSMGLANIGSQAWVNWMADLVPARVRGKYFARRSRYGIVVMVLTGLGVGLLMDCGDSALVTRWVGPLAAWAGMPQLIFLISIIFAVAALVGSLDLITFKWVDEPPMAKGPRQTLWERLSDPVKDGQFMRYCMYYSCWAFAVVWGSTFWWVYLLNFFDEMGKTGQGVWWMQYKYLTGSVLLATVSQVGLFLGVPIWGRAVDRFGRKPVLFVSSTLQTLCWIPWLFISPSMLPWLCGVQIFSGMIGGGQDIANFNMMLQFNRKGGAGYQALGSVIFSISGAVAALCAGSLANSLTWVHYPVLSGSTWGFTVNRYTILIVVGMVIKYTADLVFLPRVQDWADKPAQHALRFVFENMYGNLNTMIFTPLRNIPQSWPRTFMWGLRGSVGGLRDGIGEIRDGIDDLRDGLGDLPNPWRRKK